MKAPNKHLINAYIDWIIENEMTPHLGVDATVEGIIVPEQYVNDGRIILNVSVNAITNFFIDDTGVSFSSRFDGKSMDLFLPIQSVMVVFAKENGAGFPLPQLQMVNSEEDENTSDTEASIEEPKTPKKGKPTLSVVK